MKNFIIILLSFVSPFLPQAQTSDGTPGELHFAGYYLFDITEKWDAMGINEGWSLGNGANQAYSEYQYFGVLDASNRTIEMMKAKLTVYGDTINIGQIILSLPLYGSAFEVVNETLTIEEVKHKQPKILLYPNPAEDIVVVTCDEYIDKIDVYNLTGQLINSVRVNATEATIAISDWESGVYLLNVWVSNFVKSKKLIKK